MLEAGNFLPQKHQSILLNLFDLEAITVDDVMTPRNQIEAIDLDAPLDEIARAVATAYHTRLPVYRGSPTTSSASLHVRKVLNLVQQATTSTHERLTRGHARALFRAVGHAAASPSCRIPGAPGPHRAGGRRIRRVEGAGDARGHPRGDHRRVHHPLAAAAPARFRRRTTAAILVEGGTLLRELNRKLGFSFPLDGPKTLNGLILEHLQDIPEPGTSVKIAGHPMEIVQTQDRVVKAVRLSRPRAMSDSKNQRRI